VRGQKKRDIPLMPEQRKGDQNIETPCQMPLASCHISPFAV
jgi:hypothetical protein